MNYLQRSKRTPYGRNLAVLAAVFLLGWAFFSLAGGFILSAISPVWRGENAVAQMLRRTGESVKLHSSLVSENLSLKERLASLELELAAAHLSLSESRSMTELLGREREEGEIIASVLTRPPQSPYDLFVIDAGSDDGLAPGGKVSLPEGPLVGTVTDVFASSAKVKLFSSAGERTEAVLERKNAPVILEGRGGGSFRIVVPRETEAVPGDRVVSPESGSLLLAVVESIEADPTDSFKEILARSPANIFYVRLVSVSHE